MTWYFWLTSKSFPLVFPTINARKSSNFSPASPLPIYFPHATNRLVLSPKPQQTKKKKEKTSRVCLFSPPQMTSFRSGGGKFAWHQSRFLCGKWRATLICLGATVAKLVFFMPIGHYSIIGVLFLFIFYIKIQNVGIMLRFGLLSTFYASLFFGWHFLAKKLGIFFFWRLGIRARGATKMCFFWVIIGCTSESLALGSPTQTIF